MKTAKILLLPILLPLVWGGEVYAQSSGQRQGSPDSPPSNSLAEILPEAVSPSAGEGAPPPALSSILEQSGVESPPVDAAGSGELAQQPTVPGMELPLDGSDPATATKKLTPEEDEALMRKEAFKGAITGIMPLKPGEIRTLLEKFDETAQASETPVFPDPSPESGFQMVSLDPGQKPLVVKTAIGNVTTLSLVDITGQPWPIQDLSWAGNFEVLQPESGSNMLRITPMAQFAKGNVSMKLVGLNPPVILTLVADRKSVHVRMDVQIPEIGPNGVPPLVEGQESIKAGDSTVAGILEGVPPSSAKPMKVSGVDGRTTAYDTGGAMFVRTPYNLLSPGWNNSAQSADGMHVYALPYTPVLILSDKGKMLRAYLTREEQSDVQ